MVVDLSALVGSFRKNLVSLQHILARGADHCRERDIAAAEMLEWRLAEDMYPLRQQAQFVCNLAAEWGARAAGVAIPPPLEGGGDLDEILTAASAATDFLQQLQPDQFAGRDNIPITIDLGVIEPTMPLGQWVVGFAATNLHFHLSIAYAILRSRGVPLGKQDLFAGGL